MEPIRPSPCTRASLTLLSDLQHGPPEVLCVSHPGHTGFSQAVSFVKPPVSLCLICVLCFQGDLGSALGTVVHMPVKFWESSSPT